MAVLREFLVAITYKVNNQRSFMQGLTAATAAFGTLSKVAVAASTIAVAAVTKMSDSLDKLYFVSQRTKASAENLFAFSYAARQTGSSAEGLTSSIENMASRLRRLPGLTQLMGNFGVDGRGDPVIAMQKLYQRLANKPEWLQLQYADLFGIDEKTWLALKNMGAYVQDQKNIAKSLGVNMDVAAKSANTLWTQLRRVGTVIDVIVAKVVQELATKYAESFNDFSEVLIRNGESIQKIIIKLVEIFLKFVEGIGAVGKALGTTGQLILTFFDRLDPAIQKTIVGVGLLLAAWRLLNAGFLATPLGRIVAGMVALSLIIDDYMTYRQHGHGDNGSYFDWSKVDDLGNLVGDAMRKAGEYARTGWQWLIDIVEWFNRFSPAAAPPGQGGQPTRTGGSWLGRITDRIRGGAAGPSRLSPGELDSATAINDELARHNFNPAQRAAMLATIQRESRFNPRADAIDRNGERSYGLFQHNGPRLRAMMAHYGVSRPEELTWQQQVAYMAHELRTSERQRGAAFLGATDADTAGRGFTDVIRPYDPTGDVRRRAGESATQWMERTRTPTGGLPPGATQNPAGVGDQSSISFTPTATINVTTSDPMVAARQVLAGQSDINHIAMRNLRSRIS